MDIYRAASRLDLRLCQRAKSRYSRRKHLLNIDHVRLKNCDIRVHIAGRGPTLVMLPDPPNTIEHHQQLIAELEHGFRVVCFEFPGFGFSYPKPGMQYTLAGLTQVFHELFTVLDITNASMAISCLGAYVGINYAIQYPAEIRSLILIQVADLQQAIRWSYKADVFGLIRMPFLGQLLTQSAQMQIARQWYQSALGLPSTDITCRNYTGISLESIDSGTCFCLASAYQMLQNRTEIDWDMLKQPVLIVWGAKDKTHSETEPRAITSLISDNTFVQFDNSAHFPNLEEVERFSKLAREWIY
jgi:pimeloyl-ACP methyl ester carboxylesterase